jgi:hypothetical protein
VLADRPAYDRHVFRLRRSLSASIAASGGIGPVDPKLWDIVGGAQYFLYDNFKLIAEYRHGEKDLGSVPAAPEQLKKTVENAVFTGVRLVF